MKQMIFLTIMMTYFSLRSLIDPFWGLLLYYGLAVLRPQSIWEWALPSSIRWSFIAAMVAIVTALMNFESLRHRIVQKRFILLLVLFGLCLVKSYLGAMDHRIAGYYGWEYAKVLIMLILACFVITEKWHVRYLAWMIFLCLMYLAYEVNSLYLFSQRLDIYHRGYGGLDNNGAALMLAMVIPFCYYFFLAEHRWWRWGFLLCLFPAAHAVMLTYSRGAMLSAGLVGMLILLGSIRKRFVQTVVLGTFMVAVVLSLAGPEIRNRFTTIYDSDPGGSKESRLTSWRIGLEIARDYPLFGVGIRNSNLLTYDYGADMEGRTIHNIYIQIAADSGIPAGIIFILLIAISFWYLHVSAQRSKQHIKDPEHRWHYYISIATFWSLAIFCIGSIFLSFETFELFYLLMLIGAVSPVLAAQAPKKLQTSVTVTSVKSPNVKMGLPIRGQPV